MYRVEWLQSALNELASLWTPANSSLRKAISDAANEAELRLQGDPVGNSESRAGGRRVLFAPPLGVLFRIEADDQTVTVLKVWLFRTRGQP